MLWISILVGSGDTPKIMAIKEEPLKFAFLVYYYSSYLFTLYSLLISEENSGLDLYKQHYEYSKESAEHFLYSGNPYY